MSGRIASLVGSLLLKHHLRSTLLVILTAALWAAFVSISAQTSQTNSGQQKTSSDLADKLLHHQLLSPEERLRHLQPSKHSGLIPEGEFGNNQAESPEQQAHRRLREEVHKGLYQQPIIDPGFLVKGEPETIHLSFIDSMRIDDGSGDTDELPVHESAAIVIGTVKSAKAFLSQHRTSVYSDFQITIEQVLKRDLAHPVFPEEVIVGSRPGGSIHFASGHVTTFIIRDSGFPQVGKRYVFFLANPNKNLAEYAISMAYELSKGGNVLPINDAIDKQFDGMKTEQFMERLRDAIAQRGGQ